MVSPTGETDIVDGIRLGIPDQTGPDAPQAMRLRTRDFWQRKFTNAIPEPQRLGASLPGLADSRFGRTPFGVAPEAVTRLLSHIARRRTLESHIAAVAACRGKVHHRTRLIALFEQIEAYARQGDIEALLEVDEAFERTIAEAAILTKEGHELQHLKTDFRSILRDRPVTLDLNVAAAFRGPLLAAICCQNPGAAQTAIANFFDYLLAVSTEESR